ncbi:MAG: glycosyl transferase, partial [Rhodobacteraceae bacterium]|nr:glycosyl transferase [Paracoccaceae bacterium]
MAGSGGKKTGLVAEKRYGAERAAKSAPKPAPKPKTAKTSKLANGRSRRGSGGRSGGGNIIVAFFLGIFTMIWRLVWGVGWRVGLFAAMILFGFSYYYYVKLPDYGALIDARAQGSVTLLDRDGKVFA